MDPGSHLVSALDLMSVERRVGFCDHVTGLEVVTLGHTVFVFDGSHTWGAASCDRHLPPEAGTALVAALGKVAASQCLVVLPDALVVASYVSDVKARRSEDIRQSWGSGSRPAKGDVYSNCATLKCDTVYGIPLNEKDASALRAAFGGGNAPVRQRISCGTVDSPDVETVSTWIMDRLRFALQFLRRTAAAKLPTEVSLNEAGSSLTQMKNEFENLRLSLYNAPEAEMETTVSVPEEALSSKAFLEALRSYAARQDEVEQDDNKERPDEDAFDLFFRKISIEIVFSTITHFVMERCKLVTAQEVIQEQLCPFLRVLACPFLVWKDDILELQDMIKNSLGSDLLSQEKLCGSCERLVRALVINDMGNDILSSEYEKALQGKGRQSKHGQFYTPRDAIAFLYDQVPDLAYEKFVFLAPVTGAVTVRSVLDPACGSGGFLVSYVARVINQFEKLPEFQEHRGNPQSVFQLLQGLVEGVRGFELDPHAASLTRLNLMVHCLLLVQRVCVLDEKYADALKQLPSFKIDCANALELYGTGNLNGKYNFIVANPPYLSRRGKNSKGSIFDFLALKEWSKFTLQLRGNDIDKTSTAGALSYYHWFLLMAASVLDPTGRLVFVIPPRWMELVGFCKVLSGMLNVRRVFMFRQGAMFSAFTDACALVATGHGVPPPPEMQVFTFADASKKHYESYAKAALEGVAEGVTVHSITFGGAMWQRCSELAASGWDASYKFLAPLRKALEKGMKLEQVFETHTAPHVPPKPFFARPLHEWEKLLGTGFQEKYKQFRFVPIVRGVDIGHYCSFVDQVTCEYLLVAPRAHVIKLGPQDALRRYLRHIRSCYDADERVKAPAEMQAKAKKFTQKAFMDHLGLDWSSVQEAYTTPHNVQTISRMLETQVLAFQGKFSKGSGMSFLPKNCVVLSNNCYVVDKKEYRFAVLAWWNSMLGATYMLRCATTTYTNMMGFPEQKLKAARLPFASGKDAMFAVLARLGEALFDCAARLSGIHSLHFAWMYGPDDKAYNEEQNVELLRFAALQAALDDSLFSWAAQRGFSQDDRTLLESMLDFPPHHVCLKLRKQPWWNEFVASGPDLALLNDVERLKSVYRAEESVQKRRRQAVEQGM